MKVGRWVLWTLGLVLLPAVASASTPAGCYNCVLEQRYDYVWYEYCHHVYPNESGNGIYCKQRYYSFPNGVGGYERYQYCYTSGGACYYIIVEPGPGGTTQSTLRNLSKRSTERVVHVY